MFHILQDFKPSSQVFVTLWQNSSIKGNTRPIRRQIWTTMINGRKRVNWMEKKIEKTSFKSCEKSHKVCQISSFSMFSSSITLHVCSLSCFVNWNQLNLGDIQCYHTSILPLNVSFIISSWWGLSGDRMMNLLNSSGNISWTENFKMRLPFKWVLPNSSKAMLRLYVF